MRGSVMIDDEPLELHELISSHSGRHSFITNTIELGTMDYKDYNVSLRGHSTTSSFLRICECFRRTTKKRLVNYTNLDTTDDTEGEKKLVQLYNKLTGDSEKKFLMGWLENEASK